MYTHLYVTDVEAIAKFFQDIGLTEVKREQFGPSTAVTLSPDPAGQGNAFLQVWDKDFIRQTSPEVADNEPSIAFFVTDIAEAHERVSKHASFTSEIVDMGGQRSFYFADPLGQHYAFIESPA